MVLQNMETAKQGKAPAASAKDAAEGRGGGRTRWVASRSRSLCAVLREVSALMPAARSSSARAAARISWKRASSARMSARTPPAAGPPRAAAPPRGGLSERSASSRGGDAAPPGAPRSSFPGVRCGVPGSPARRGDPDAAAAKLRVGSASRRAPLGAGEAPPRSDCSHVALIWAPGAAPLSAPCGGGTMRGAALGGRGAPGWC